MFKLVLCCSLHWFFSNFKIRICWHSQMLLKLLHLNRKYSSLIVWLLMKLNLEHGGMSTSAAHVFANQKYAYKFWPMHNHINTCMNIDAEKHKSRKVICICSTELVDCHLPKNEVVSCKCFSAQPSSLCHSRKLRRETAAYERRRSAEG